MAVTVTLYDHTPKLLANKEITFSTLKFLLLGTVAVTAFSAAHTALAQVIGSPSDEFSGNGWTALGMTLANVAVTQVTTNDAKLDADDITVTATGGAIGPAYGGVLYDDTGDLPLAMVDFGQSQTAGQDTDFKIVWNASGIILFSYT